MSDPRATSIRQRLLNRARQTGENYNQLLTRYVGLRFLHRLALSAHNDQFVLKGATMFLIWQGSMHRPTRDIDLLGAIAADEHEIETVVKHICATDCDDDGLVFHPDTVRAEAIREDNNYGGIRCTVVATLGSARQTLQIDIRFGDSVTPSPSEVEIPRLMDDESVTMFRAYPVETLVAEKLEAMVALGIGNSRMKDFLDLSTLAETTEMNGETLVEAIRATFYRRRTTLPEGLPKALTDAFWNDPVAQSRWRAFGKRLPEAEDMSLEDVCRRILRFLGEPLSHARKRTFREDMACLELERSCLRMASRNWELRRMRLPKQMSLPRHGDTSKTC